MKCFRMYTDEKGESQLEMIEFSLRDELFSPREPAMGLSQPETVERVIFARIPPHWSSERHVAPHRQYFVQLSGLIEVELLRGRTFCTGPGDITLIEDTEGSGHITRVLGEEPVTGAFVQLP